MKLLVAITHQDDAEEAVDALLAKDFGATRIESASGFLNEGNAILLMGVEEGRTAEALDILRGHCRSHMMEVKLPLSPMPAETRLVEQPIQLRVGGALVFILNVDHFEQW